MSGPPQDVPADELWARIVQSDKPEERPYELVDFPRNDPKTGEPLGKLAIWVLKDNEITVAKAEATRYARACIKEKFDAVERVEGYAQVFEDACATELVWRFCRRHDNRLIPAFPTAAKCREHLTGDEKAVLVNAYALIQVKFGPMVSRMDPEDYEAWIKRLREGGSAVPLSLLTWEQRIDLTMYLVDQLYLSRTGSSSAGKQPAELILSDTV